ncbi:MAG TPA: oxidoreductase [Pseudobdellovibrionaceae bacterium]|nr:oxidoreductase [Pseudobdellovibrionaceae bacterium]
MIAVVAGATGLVGEILTRKLLEEPNVRQVKIVVRKAAGFSHPKLSTVSIPDFKDLESRADELRGTHYFCALGTTIKTAGSRENFRAVDFDAIVQFGHLASGHGADLLSVVSAMGANEDSSIFYNQVKGETEKALMALPLKKLRLYRPGLLLGKRQEHRAGEKFAIQASAALKLVLPKRWFKALATEASVLAERMIADAKDRTTGSQVVPAKDI